MSLRKADTVTVEADVFVGTDREFNYTSLGTGYKYPFLQNSVVAESCIQSMHIVKTFSQLFYKYSLSNSVHFPVFGRFFYIFVIVTEYRYLLAHCFSLLFTRKYFFHKYPLNSIQMI